MTEYAFPIWEYGQSGMTLRQWYAGMALSGFCSDREWGRKNRPVDGESPSEVMVEACFTLADEMIEFEKKEGK